MKGCCLCDLFAVRFRFALILSSVIILLLILLSPKIVYSFDITLAWNMAEVEELAGFKTFYREEGQDYNYDNPAWDGNVSACTITIADFKEGVPYYFVVKAYSTMGDVSDNSNEVRYLSTENLAPIADAGPDLTKDEGLTVTLDGSCSVDPDGNIISYNWIQLTGTNVELTDSNLYQASFIAPDIGPGGELLTFQLTVTDDEDLQSTDICEVNVSNVDDPPINTPPTAEANGPYTGTEGQAVSFSSAGSGDVNGDSLTYNWNFGDGAISSNANPSHTYVQNGVYNVTLTLNDGSSNKSDTAMVTVSDIDPIVNFSATPTSGEAPLTVNFTVTASSYDGITSYSWNFGDGSTYEGENPRHTFTDSGTYTVSLSATEPDGDIATDTCIIKVTYMEELPTLTSLSISGDGSLNENSVSNYIAIALFSDGNTRTVTDAVTWSADSPYANIDGTGKLSALEVMKDEIITITANYNFNGLTKITEKPVTIIDISEPTPDPFKPVITSPLDGQTDCELMAHLTTLPFSDPNGNTHTQTQWQISKQETFSTLILDITSNEHLTELSVPSLVLEPETTYYVRARFFNSFPEISDWSDIVEFRTTSDINDLNYNGIPDGQEILSNTDINADGIDDYSQPETIKCVQTNYSADTIAATKDPNSVFSIEAMQAIDPSAISEETRKPRKIMLALFAYRIRLNEPGITIYQRIYFSSNIRMAKSFYKYDSIYGWEDYTQYVTFDYETNSIIVELTDGGKGDSDGTANGIIVDPGGLVEDDSAEIFDNGSPKGGCFIESLLTGR
ncbi:MAG: PKD domain-containing protein [bacterium]